MQLPKTGGLNFFICWFYTWTPKVVENLYICKTSWNLLIKNLFQKCATQKCDRKAIVSFTQSLLKFQLAWMINISRHNKFLFSLIIPCTLCKFFPDPFVPNAPLLFPLKTSENLAVFWCFQWVEKGSIRNEWVNWTMSVVHSTQGSTSKFSSFYSFKRQPQQFKQFVGKSRRIVWVCLTTL